MFQNSPCAELWGSQPGEIKTLLFYGTVFDSYMSSCQQLNSPGVGAEMAMLGVEIWKTEGSESFYSPF